MKNILQWKKTKLITLALLLFCGLSNAQDQNEQGITTIDEGYQLVKSRKKGNCLACHIILGEVSPGHFGPPLISMKSRFPDRMDLFNQVWDATKMNPITSMPPFGKHMILTKAEIEKIVTYLLTL
jgi:sulfur-oxidizing protein SoxX